MQGTKRGNRRALSVGINRYANPGNDLRGCVNDSYMVREMLVKHYGFMRSDVTLLLDTDATYSNIESELERLTHETNKGDVLVFHYSGHGSHVVDISGEEEDGQDEIICPHDMDWSRPFKDDYIAKLTRVQKGVNMTLIMDCCHSGTIHRDLIPPGTPMPVMSRYLTPPTALIPNVRERKHLTRRYLEGLRPEETILLSGCQDNQTSADAWIDMDYHGAFTYYFNETLRDSNWTTNYGSLIETLRMKLAIHHFTQVPNIAAPDWAMGKNFLESI